MTIDPLLTTHPTTRYREAINQLIGEQPLSEQPVGAPGQLSQVRAGRELTAVDFTTLLGLDAPAGLWNLGSASDASGNARDLTNKGAVVFGAGVTGAAAEAAIFTGATSKALYRADAGASDPFRIRTGSFGCWFRTAKRGTSQSLMSKWGAGGSRSWLLMVTSGNEVIPYITTNGTDSIAITPALTVDVADDQWHFAVAVFDGGELILYVDGQFVGSAPVDTGLIFNAAGPLNIGANSADASTAAASPFYGRIDEAFVTADVLTAKQIALLHAAKVTHSLGSLPLEVRGHVRRRPRGRPLATGDFPAVSPKLYNLAASEFDPHYNQGASAVDMFESGSGLIYTITGPDGGARGATQLPGTGHLYSTDAGLPSGLSARSYGIWFRTHNDHPSGATILGWGTTATGDARIGVVAGLVHAFTGGTSIAGPAIDDGDWHHLVVVEDDSAVDGLRQKLYVDGALVASGTTLNSITLGGSSGFRVGAAPNGVGVVSIGAAARAFVLAEALTPEQVAQLYAIGGATAAHAPLDQDAIVAVDDAHVYLALDGLAAEPQDIVDLYVGS